MIRNQNPLLRIRDIERIHNETFASWFANQVSLSSTKILEIVYVNSLFLIIMLA